MFFLTFIWSLLLTQKSKKSGIGHIWISQSFSFHAEKAAVIIQTFPDFEKNSNRLLHLVSKMDSENHVLMESMLCKEETIYAQHDYLDNTLPITAVEVDTSGNCHMPVDQFCRNIMTKWCYSLCKFCSYDRHMVASVMSCVDKFVATRRGSKILLDRDKYQLAVMASLYLVAKIQQTQALEPESIARLSRGKYTKADIESMELEILISLKFFVNPPTPMHFAQEFMESFDIVPQDVDVEHSPADIRTTEERIMELVKYQLEEATTDYELSCLIRPSHVAFGAFINALDSLNIDTYDMKAMTILKNCLQMTDVNAVCESLLRVVSSSETSNKSLSSLLLHRCNEHSRKTTKISDQESSRIVSSCFPTSPRTVAEGICATDNLRILKLSSRLTI